MKKLVGQDSNREITDQLLSQPKQTQLCGKLMCCLVKQIWMLRNEGKKQDFLSHFSPSLFHVAFCPFLNKFSSMLLWWPWRGPCRTGPGVAQPLVIAAPVACTSLGTSGLGLCSLSNGSGNFTTTYLAILTPETEARGMSPQAPTGCALYLRECPPWCGS